MFCPLCKKGDTRVLESRESENALRRRRECTKCLRRFTTYERVETTNVVVIKRDGTREQFDRDKLKNGIVRSCQKRPVTTAQVDAAIESIENDLRSGPKDEITSTKIGQLVMKYLKKLDKVAYIRFASVYLDFKDPEDFESAMKEVMGKK